MPSLLYSSHLQPNTQLYILSIITQASYLRKSDQIPSEAKITSNPHQVQQTLPHTSHLHFFSKSEYLADISVSLYHILYRLIPCARKTPHINDKTHSPNAISQSLKQIPPSNPSSSKQGPKRHLLSLNLHTPDLAVRLSRIDLLARLCDRLEHCLVLERRLGDDGGGLGF